MSSRSNRINSAILVVMLAVSQGMAQDDPHSASSLTVPPFPIDEGTSDRDHVLTPSVWMPERSSVLTVRIPDDGIKDASVAPPAASEIRWSTQPDPQVVESALTGSQSDVVETESDNAARFAGRFSNESSGLGIGVDFYSPPEFEGGLIVFGKDVAMKIGGYVKADFIYDFDPIDSTDSFATNTIPVGAAPRTNSRFHARQTRLSFDTRWAAGEQTVRVFVEGDFFSMDNQYRLRHAYGEVGSLLVGQTWTTFTDISAAPATIDFEGSVSSINRRQAQARWTQSIFHEDLTVSFAVEDTKFIIVPPTGIQGESRSPSPDFVSRVRFARDWGQFQIAYLYRIGGFQPTGGEVISGSAGGVNFTGALLLSERLKAYYQIVTGEGIGSYRGLPDAAPATSTTDELLGMFGWMAGVTQEWSDDLSSNFTYAQNKLNNTAMQDADDLHRTTYLSANLLWSPLERVTVGVEYLYGLRENIDRQVGVANRAQVAFIFDLP